MGRANDCFLVRYDLDYGLYWSEPIIFCFGGRILDFSGIDCFVLFVQRILSDCINTKKVINSSFKIKHINQKYQYSSTCGAAQKTLWNNQIGIFTHAICAHNNVCHKGHIRALKDKSIIRISLIRIMWRKTLQIQMMRSDRSKN